MKEYLEVGKIVNTSGLKGLLKVSSTLQVSVVSLDAFPVGSNTLTLAKSLYIISLCITFVITFL